MMNKHTCHAKNMYTINPKNKTSRFSENRLSESQVLDEFGNKYVRRKLIIKETEEFSRVKSQTGRAGI